MDATTGSCSEIEEIMSLPPMSCAVRLHEPSSLYGDQDPPCPRSEAERHLRELRGRVGAWPQPATPRCLGHPHPSAVTGPEVTYQTATSSIIPALDRPRE